MDFIFRRFKIYIERTHYKGILSIPIFIFIFWNGLNDLLRKSEIYFVFFIAGIITVVILQKFIMKYSKYFYTFATVIIISFTVVGFIMNIPQLDKFFNDYDRLFGYTIWFLLGIMFSASFRIYSEPGDTIN
jgi:hypothetical protein